MLLALAFGKCGRDEAQMKQVISTTQKTFYFRPRNVSSQLRKGTIGRYFSRYLESPNSPILSQEQRNLIHREGYPPATNQSPTIKTHLTIQETS